MSKKSVFLAVIALLVLLGYGCDDTMSVKLKVDNLELGAHVKVGNVDLADVLNKQLKDSFEENGILLYDWTKYSNSKIQAFVAAYSVSLGDYFEFNPDAILSDINDQLDKMGNIDSPDIPAINPDTIVVPKISPDPIHETYWFSMVPLFGGMEDQINTTSMPQVPINLPILIGGGPATLSLPPGTLDLPNFMAFTLSGEENFDWVKIASGEVRLNLELTAPGGGVPDSDIDIELFGINLIADGLGSPIGTPQNQSIRLNDGNGFQGAVVIDLEDAEIRQDNPPKFEIGGITSHFAGTPKLVDFDLVIQPQLQDIRLRGAHGLQLNTMTKELDAEFPDFPDTIDLAGGIPDEFLNATILEGTLTIKADLPERSSPFAVGETFCEGLKITYNFLVEQDPNIFDGITFPGLSETMEWENGDDIDLENKIINGKEINIDKTLSMITLEKKDSTGISFELHDDRYNAEEGGTAFETKTLPLDFIIEMSVESLDLIHWALEREVSPSVIEKLIEIPEIPGIDFGDINGEDISEYVQSITLEDMELIIDFTIPGPPNTPAGLTPGPGLPDALNGKIAVKLTCADLGIDQTEILRNTGLLPGQVPLGNVFDIPLGEIILKNPDDSAKEIKFDVDIIPVIGGVPVPGAKYLEIGPLYLDPDNDTELDMYGTIRLLNAGDGPKQGTPEIVWTEAVINLENALEKAGSSISELKGEYPEDPGEFFNQLYEIRDTMQGFTLDASKIEIKMYLGGPHALIDVIEPKLNFGMSYEDEEAVRTEITLLEDVALNSSYVSDLSVVLPPPVDGKYIYDELYLPDGGIGIDNLGAIVDAIASLPKDMRISYAMDLPTIFTVTPDMFEDIDEGGATGIEALLVVKLPLEFIAEPGARIFIPAGDIFEDDHGSPKDLFGRESIDDSLFKDITVNSVGIRIDFEQSFFDGAYLHIDSWPDEDERLFGKNGLKLTPNQGNCLELVLNKTDWAAINHHLIYPDISIEFPAGTTLRIPRNPLPTGFRIAASISEINITSLLNGD